MKDLIGKKFNKLIVIDFDRVHVSPSGRKHNYWLCKCECGNIKSIAEIHLIQGNTKSCGCLIPSHGLHYHSIRSNYRAMKARCYNVNNNSYKYYGARGITVCNEWKDKYNGLKNFYEWSIKNDYKEGLTIDRIDVNGNYEPNNCRWVDYKTQIKNRHNSIIIKYKNQEHSLKEWSDIFNIKYKTLYQRIKRDNKSFEEAIKMG